MASCDSPVSKAEFSRAMGDLTNCLLNGDEPLGEGALSFPEQRPSLVAKLREEMAHPGDVVAEYHFARSAGDDRPGPDILEIRWPRSPFRSATEVAGGALNNMVAVASRHLQDRGHRAMQLLPADVAHTLRVHQPRVDQGLKQLSALLTVFLTIATIAAYADPEHEFPQDEARQVLDRAMAVGAKVVSQEQIVDAFRLAERVTANLILASGLTCIGSIGATLATICAHGLGCVSAACANTTFNVIGLIAGGACGGCLAFTIVGAAMTVARNVYGRIEDARMPEMSPGDVLQFLRFSVGPSSDAVVAVGVELETGAMGSSSDDAWVAPLLSAAERDRKHELEMTLLDGVGASK